jgi:serine/threonine-protein kinase RsbW
MENKHLIIANKIDQLDRIQQFLEQLGSEWNLAPDLVFQLNLVLEEYISNLICYGYSDQEEHEISLEILKEEAQVTMIVTDDGDKFNILELPGTDEIEKPLKERKIGGLGIHFIKTLTDHLEYGSDGKMNKFRMVKKIFTS